MDSEKGIAGKYSILLNFRINSYSCLYSFFFFFLRLIVSGPAHILRLIVASRSNKEECSSKNI
jgi:hypothetical protein